MAHELRMTAPYFNGLKKSRGIIFYNMKILWNSNFSLYKQGFIGTYLLTCFITQLCPTLCHSMDCNPPSSSVHGIFQARILERVAIFLLLLPGSSWPRDRTQISCIAGGFFTVWTTGETLIGMLAQPFAYILLMVASVLYNSRIK